METSTALLKKRTIFRTALAYAACLLFFIALPNVYFLQNRLRSSAVPIDDGGNQDLIDKTAFYLRNRQHFNLLFLGDSVTRECIDPETIERVLPAVRSFNLGWLMHWIATEYVHFYDLIPQIPKNTVVVWTIRHGMFSAVPKSVFNYSYPIRWDRVPAYLKCGYRPWDMADNVTYFNFYKPYADIVPGLALHARRKNLYDRFLSWLHTPGAVPYFASVPGVEAQTPKPPVKNLDEYLLLKRKYSKNPHVLSVGWRKEGNTVIAAVLTKREGNITLIELEPEHFRNGQRQTQIAFAKVKDNRMHEYPPHWKLFVRTVRLFQASGIWLILNEFDCSAIYYGSEENHAEHDRWMEKVRRFAASENIPYIRSDSRSIPDDHFFDMVHLNQRGSCAYSEKLGRTLKWILEGGQAK